MQFLFRIITPVFAVLSLLFLYTKVTAYFKSAELFALEQFEVKGTVKKTDTLIHQKLIKHQGENIFLVDIDAIKREIEKIPRVKQASVSRGLPNKILVRYDSEEPVAILLVDDLYYVNQNGKIYDSLSYGDDRSFPLIQTNLRNKKRLSSLNIQAAMNLLQAFDQSHIIQKSDLGDVLIHEKAYPGVSPLRFTLQFPPAKIRNKDEGYQYIPVSITLTNLKSQINKLESVIGYLSKMKQKPKEIRLELGKKVVVKIAQ